MWISSRHTKRAAVGRGGQQPAHLDHRDARHPRGRRPSLAQSGGIGGVRVVDVVEA